MSEQERLVTELRQEVQGLREVLQKRLERIIIFIDNTNLNFTIRKMDSTGEYRLCYEKLVNFLTANRFLRQCRIYYSDYGRDATLSTEESIKRQEREGFYSWLKWKGYWLKGCNLIERRDGSPKEKGLDAAIIKDIQRLSQQSCCDTVILVAGDGDYRDLLADIQSLYGIRVEVAFFAEGNCTSQSLKHVATEFVDLGRAKDLIRRT